METIRAVTADSKVKVTDKRKFTPEGELKEDYRGEPDSFTPEPSGAARKEAAATAKKPGAPTSEPPDAEESAPELGPESPPSERVEEPSSRLGQPTAMDLISILAEPVAIYLGETKLPDGQNAQDFDRARFHIDLLGLLRDKTRGNLSPEESAVLEDLIYRLRMLYVEMRK